MSSPTPEEKPSPHLIPLDCRRAEERIKELEAKNEKMADALDAALTEHALTRLLGDDDPDWVDTAWDALAYGKVDHA